MAARPEPVPGLRRRRSTNRRPDAGRLVSWADALAAPVSRIGFGLIGRSSSPRLSILIFHRVHARKDSLFGEEWDAGRFDRLVRMVSRGFRPMTLGKAAGLLARGQLPPGALVVTFDDGYADNAEVALPILQRHGVPATFFVSTGFLDGGRMWNDSVIESIRACTLDALDLSELGLGRHPLSTPQQRRACIDAVLPKVKYLPLRERESVVQRLQQASGARRLPDDLMMRSDQVRALHRAGMEIGAHTVNHPVLTSLDVEDAEREIADGRKRLEEIVGAPVDVIAYPNGKPRRDYDERHVAMVRRLGFKAAVSTATGVARAGDDLFQLPRFTPWDRSMLAWSARLMLNQRATAFDRV